MHATPVHFTSLDRIAERVLDHLRQGHLTALVGSPGCGMTTFLWDLTKGISGAGFTVVSLDAKSKALPELLRDLGVEGVGNSPRRVFVLDNFARFSIDDLRRLLTAVIVTVEKTGSLCLSCGSLDVRGLDRDLGLKLYTVPSAHITFPVLTRDELVTAYRATAGDRGGAHVSFPILTRDELTIAYRALASERGCRWGEAILYLMLDLCGSDLSLVRSATDYLHGDWSDRLYDESVWDRLQEWLKDDESVDAYRARLKALPPTCTEILELIRFGGKPQCLRAELIEEVNDALRRLWLDGFIIPNLLPGFYQLRNLVVRFLLDESVKPAALFRRSTNERAGALLQEAETMLRQVLVAVFSRIGLEDAQARLSGMQQPGEVIDAELNRALLAWAKENCAPESVKELSSVLMKHRQEFKKRNSAWEVANAMMRRDIVDEDGRPHLQCLNYLTLDQLGRLVLGLVDKVFPRFSDATAAKGVKEFWQEAVAKVGRLRNQVAHLRNVGFQDMEDLGRTLERMRRDVIDYGAWKMPAAVPEPPNLTAAPREAQ